MSDLAGQDVTNTLGEKATLTTIYAGPYARAAQLYRDAGWDGVLPIGKAPNEKTPPPSAFTGHGKPDPSGADVYAWREGPEAALNIGLRLPVGVIGLDVDAYDKGGKPKRGDETLAALEERWGVLPATWITTARTDGKSGIRLFRVPTHLDGREINWPGEAGPNIEIIQHGHRYALVWPSTNPEAGGASYGWRWSGNDEVTPLAAPGPGQLADLPDAWVRGLALPYDRTEKAVVGDTALAEWWSRLRGGEACPVIHKVLAQAVDDLRGDPNGARHETARDALSAIVRLGGEGHAGAASASAVLATTFEVAVGAARVQGGEWHRLLMGAVRLAMTDNPSPRQRCNHDAPPTLAGLVVPEELRPPFAEVPSAADLTDARLVERVHHELLDERYVWAQGFGWMQWTGQLWREVPGETVVEEIRRWAVGSIKPLLDNPIVTAEREVRNRLIGLLDKYRLVSLEILARGITQVDAAVFDAHPDLLNTPSGIVDLRTGALAAHDPDLFMTRITTVPYTPTSSGHADWTKALAAVPAEVGDWLQVRFGQAITGHMTPDDVVLLLQGGGQNGKSTVLGALQHALGDYATYVSDRVLLSENGAHPTELTEFRGARFTLTEELPEGAHLNVKRLKDVLGTPTMTARRMRQDSITWKSTHSLFVSTNYLPKVTETDHGTWRRLALVRFPFTYVSPEKATGAPQEREGDPTLRDRVLNDESAAEAVLAWLVAGARRWYDAGRALPPHPQAVEADTREWREQSDIVLRFWAECLEPAPECFVASADMLTVFNAWATAQGHKARSAQVFMAQFGEHERTKAAGVTYRKRRVKAGDVQSFPFAAVGVGFGQAPTAPVTPPAGSEARAWWGVRFVLQDR